MDSKTVLYSNGKNFDVDDGLYAIERIIKDKTVVQPVEDGFAFTKEDGTMYFVNGDNECDCPSSRTCKHVKVAKLLRLLLI